MTERDDIRTPTLALVGVIGAVVIFAIILLLQVIYFRTTAAQRAADLDRPYAELENLTASQQEKLASYRWIDRQKNVAGVPIARAMELTVQDIADGKLPPAQPIAKPEPKPSEKPAAKEEDHAKPK